LKSTIREKASKKYVLQDWKEIQIVDQTLYEKYIGTLVKNRKWVFNKKKKRVNPELTTLLMTTMVTTQKMVIPLSDHTMTIHDHYFISNNSLNNVNEKDISFFFQGFA